MRRSKQRWLLIGLMSAAAYVGGSLFQPTVVMGNSMSPTLASGKVIWVDRFYYRSHRPKRGEVVVFRLDGQTYVKRVYREPGEKLHYLAAGSDWVAPIRDTRVEDTARRCQKTHTSFRVRNLQIPEDAVFVLGDNLMASEDSRHFGPVPLSAIIGRAHLDVNTTIAADYEIAPEAGRNSRFWAAPRRLPSFRRESSRPNGQQMSRN